MELVVKEVIHECDVIIEVIDARDVAGTRSRKLESMVRKEGKQLIFVINKVDLKRPVGIPPGKVVLMSAKKRFGTKNLRATIMGCYPERDQVRVGVVGYANTGKSSVIVSLGGVAHISSKPGFTRGKHWIRISKRVMLMDTPGLIPSDEGEASLAIKSAYDVTKLKDPVGAALQVIEKIGSERLAATYGVEQVADSTEQLEALAKKWNMLLKGAQLDLDRASKKIIKDWQVGKLR